MYLCGHVKNRISELEKKSSTFVTYLYNLSKISLFYRSIDIILKITAKTKIRIMTELQEQNQALMFKLSQSEKKISMLESEMENLTTENQSLRDLLEADKENQQHGFNPKKKQRSGTFGQDSTCNLMDSTLNVSVFDSTNNQGYFDDNLMSAIKPKGQGRKTHLNFESLTVEDSDTTFEHPENEPGEMTKNILQLESQVEHEEKIADLMDEKEELENKNSELCEIVEKLQSQLNEAIANSEKNALNFENEITQKSEKNLELQNELEELKSELSISNVKANKYIDMANKYEDMESKMAVMEADYMDRKDKMKQGNNLFVEVEDRRMFAEKKAFEFKNEILKVREQRDGIKAELDCKRIEIKRLSGLLSAKQTFNVETDPEYIALEKDRDFYWDENERLQKESIRYQSRLRDYVKSQNVSYDYMGTLDDLYDLKQKYAKMSNRVAKSSTKAAKMEKERDEADYQLKVLQHYNTLTSDNKYHKMVNVGTWTEEFIKEDKVKMEHGEMGECKQQ